MTVPLDRLYHYLADCVNHDLVIYRWTPHGSRKLEHLSMLRGPYQNTQPIMICHDQEPVDLGRYSKQDFETAIRHYFQNHNFFKHLKKLTTDPVVSYLANLGLRGLTIPTNQFDQTLWLHSEQNSTAITTLAQQGYVPVYYWSHGMIAQDWFRYAEHDPILNFAPAQIVNDFLIYNRAWGGSREYRLCFAEQIIENGLTHHCTMSFNSVDTQHYTQHQFINADFQISNFELEKFFPKNNHSSNSSADYCNTDYAKSGIEVVLETLFDDSRWHLTEKALRPIACGRPFMLMATPGSLQYLQQYGFETFGELIDETYDQIVNPRQRLQAVIAEMSRISALPPEDKIQLFSALNQIAEQNKLHFFNKFFDQIKQEYVNNMNHAITIMNQHCTGKHDQILSKLMK